MDLAEACSFLVRGLQGGRLLERMSQTQRHQGLSHLQWRTSTYITVAFHSKWNYSSGSNHVSALKEIQKTFKWPFWYKTRMLLDQTVFPKADPPGWARDWSPAGQPGQTAGLVTFLKRGGKGTPESERKSLKGPRAAARTPPARRGHLGGQRPRRGRKWRRAPLQSRAGGRILRSPQHRLGRRDCPLSHCPVNLSRPSVG